MKLHWYGHSCFEVNNREGKRLLFDPFNEKVGYHVPDFLADVVTTSHGHYDHANVDAVKGEYVLVQGPVMHACCGFYVVGYPSFHDDENGTIRGNNTVFVVTTDDMTICHLGDLGHVLPKETLEAIGKVDVLLLPVGGGYTVDAEKAEIIRKQINPRYTVPMHYKTADCTLGIETIRPYLDLVGEASVCYVGNDICLEDLQVDSKILVMSYQ